MTFKEFGDWMGRSAQNLEQNVLAAEAESLRLLKETTAANMSNTLTPQYHDALDHPFARRHGPRGLEGVVDPDLTSVGTGALREGLRTEGPTITSGDVVSALYDVDPIAGILSADDRGNSTMVARNPQRKAAEETADLRAEYLETAIQRSFQH